jgi:hypothetical protein
MASGLVSSASDRKTNRCDPITGMARIAMDENAPLEIRARMYTELAQYVAPKRKALEHSAEPGLIEGLLARIED